jgi:hypothetical protein
MAFLAPFRKDTALPLARPLHSSALRCHTKASLRPKMVALVAAGGSGFESQGQNHGFPHENGPFHDDAAGKVWGMAIWGIF